VRRRLRACAFAAIVAAPAAGCSTLPPASYPPYADADIAAVLAVPADGRLPVPATRRDLVLYELRATPAPLGEEFAADGRRYWRYPAGAQVVLEARWRSYGDGTSPPPPPAAVLPGASRITARTDR
jgi:hypothetical protein